MQEIAKQTQFLQLGIAILGFVAFGILAKTVRFNSGRRKAAALVTVVAFAVAATWLITPRTPPASDLNGTYRGDCCEAVILRDGVLITRTEKVPFTIQLQKWGLSAVLSTPVEVRGRSIVAARSASTNKLTFSDDLKTLTICGAGGCGVGNQFQFNRQ